MRGAPSMSRTLSFFAVAFSGPFVLPCDLIFCYLQKVFSVIKKMAGCKEAFASRLPRWAVAVGRIAA